MAKYGLIFDSTSGFSQSEIEKMGHDFIPLVINIDGKEFKAGQTITTKELYNKMTPENVIKTAAATPADIVIAIDKALKKHDEVIFIGISHFMSGTQNAVQVVANGEMKYAGKVHIYNGLYMAPWTKPLVKQIIKIVETSDDLEDIYNQLDWQNDKMTGWLVPGNIVYFYNGGRITRTQYLIASLTKVKSILTVNEGRMDKIKPKVTRTTSKAISKMTDLLIEKVNSLGLKTGEYKVMVLFAGSQELTDQTIASILAKTDISEKNIIVDELGTEQVAHMGPNSFGLALTVPFPKK